MHSKASSAAVAAFASMFLLGCDSGGSDGTTADVSLNTITGTWKINRAVTANSCSGGVIPDDSVYVTLETSTGQTVTIKDALDPSDAGITVPINGRGFQVNGTGADVGDNTTVTFSSNAVNLTGTEVDAEPGCSITYRLTGVRLALPANVPTGDWTFTVSYTASGANFTQSFGTVTMAQRFTALSATSATTTLAGIVQSSGSWEGVGGFDGISLADIVIDRFTGTFTGGTNFTGTWSGSSFGVGPVSNATLTGTKNTGGGGAACTTVIPGAWELNLSNSPIGPLVFQNCVVTQTACSLSYAFSDAGTTATFSGPITGSAWAATASGNFFSGLGLTATLNGTLSGNPANALAGTWAYSGSAAGSGILSASKN